MISSWLQWLLLWVAIDKNWDNHYTRIAYEIGADISHIPVERKRAMTHPLCAGNRHAEKLFPTDSSFNSELIQSHFSHLLSTRVLSFGNQFPIASWLFALPFHLVMFSFRRKMPSDSEKLHAIHFHFEVTCSIYIVCLTFLLAQNSSFYIDKIMLTCMHTNAGKNSEKTHGNFKTHMWVMQKNSALK